MEEGGRKDKEEDEEEDRRGGKRRGGGGGTRRPSEHACTNLGAQGSFRSLLGYCFTGQIMSVAKPRVKVRRCYT